MQRSYAEKPRSTAIRRRMLLVLAATLLAAAGARAEEVSLRVHYAIPNLWAEVQDKLAAAFMERHPGVKIQLDAPAETYADGVQRLLRESVANNLPDVAYLGLNRWRILEDRQLTVPLDPFIGDPAAFAERGFTPALRSLGRFQGAQHALAVSASTLVMYVNPDLLAQVGRSVADFPDDFDDLITVAAAINGLGDGIDGVWIAAHDWRFQSILGSYGGAADERRRDGHQLRQRGRRQSRHPLLASCQGGGHARLRRRRGASVVRGRNAGNLHRQLVLTLRAWSRAPATGSKSPCCPLSSRPKTKRRSIFRPAVRRW